MRRGEYHLVGAPKSACMSALKKSSTSKPQSPRNDTNSGQIAATMRPIHEKSLVMSEESALTQQRCDLCLGVFKINMIIPLLVRCPGHPKCFDLPCVCCCYSAAARWEQRMRTGTELLSILKGRVHGVTDHSVRCIPRAHDI